MITPRLTQILLAAGLLFGSLSNLSAQNAPKAPVPPKAPATRPTPPTPPKPPVPQASVLTDDTLVIVSADNKKVVVRIKRSEASQSFDSQRLDSLLNNLDLQLDENVEAQIQAALNDNKSGRVIISSEEITPSGKRINENELTVDLDVRKDRLKKVVIEGRADSDGPLKVSINRGEAGDSSKVIVSGKDPKKKRSVGGCDIDLGLNAFMNDAKYLNSNGSDANYELRPWGSRYVSINMYKGARIGGANSPLQIRSGLNFAFNNYMWEENVYLQKEGQHLNFIPDSVRNFQKSKLAVTTINVPLNLRLQFNRGTKDDGFMLTAGGFVGYRIGSHTKLKFDENGDTKKVKDAGAYGLEDMQYGVNFGIGYMGFELFTKYHLNNLFKDGRGPQTNVIAFGITI